MAGPRPSDFKELRLVKGFNLSELAKESGVSRSTIYKIEEGDYNIEPRGNTYGRLADALDMEASEVRDYVLKSIDKGDDQQDD